MICGLAALNGLSAAQDMSAFHPPRAHGRPSPDAIGSTAVTTSVISPVRLLPPAMAAPAVLPRLVIRGDTALSWEGPVTAEETVEGLDRGLQTFGRVLIWDLGSRARTSGSTQESDSRTPWWMSSWRARNGSLWGRRP